MKKPAQVATLATLVALAAGLTAAATKARDAAAASPLTSRFSRTAKVWKLSARNSARFAVMKVRGATSPADRRAQLDEQFAIRTAADVAKELGEMKGVLMKAGQLVSFIFESLPDEAQAALATLQADAAPMAPSLAAGVVESELGAPPERAFLDWTDLPVAAASIGQVHRAVTRHGDEVAVKVQYPGVGDAIEADLANADVLYRLITSFALKGLDTRALVEELRTRMRDELDYRIEAANVHEFRAAFADHPFVSLPGVVDELSTRRVITTEWVDGLSWNEFLVQASPDARRRAGESIWRFAQHAIHRLGIFNGDPHPGNYRFSPDGDVTFLDFGMVKRWSPGEWEVLEPCMDAIVIDRDPERLLEMMERSGFLRPGHGLAADVVWDYVSAPYRPYLTDVFTFDRAFMRDTIQRIIDVNGPHAEVIERINMPPSFLMLDRVVWGITALLGKLELTAPWRAMVLEYRCDAPPATPLGELERQWRATREDPQRR